MTRQELLKARADVESQLSELSYACIIGSGTGVNPKDALRQRLRDVLAAIDQQLAELGQPPCLKAPKVRSDPQT